MKKILAVVLLALIFSGCSGPHQLATKEQLDDVTRKGRLLYDYDGVCWIASDSVASLKSDKEHLGQFIASRQDSNWLVVFGKIGVDQSAFLIIY